jgi:hypothetical protein
MRPASHRPDGGRQSAPPFCGAGFSITVHAILKYILAPLRTTLGAVTLPLGDAVSLDALPGGPLVWTAALTTGALAVAALSGNRPETLIPAACLGALIPLAWVTTGDVLHDDFDPVAMEILSFTSPCADTLFWNVAATSVPAGFGVGLIGGTQLGAWGASLSFGSFRWQAFLTTRETGRYGSGAVLMHIGGVRVGG